MTGKRLFLGLILAAILLDRGIVYAQTAATLGAFWVPTSEEMIPLTKVRSHARYLLAALACTAR